MQKLKLGQTVVADDNGQLVTGVLTYIQRLKSEYDDSPEDREDVGSIDWISWYAGFDRSPHADEDLLVQLDNDCNKWYTGNKIFPSYATEDYVSSMRRRLRKSYMIVDFGEELTLVTINEDGTDGEEDPIYRYNIEVHEKGEKPRFIGEGSSDLYYLLVKYDFPDIYDSKNRKVVKASEIGVV